MDSRVLILMVACVFGPLACFAVDDNSKGDHVYAPPEPITPTTSTKPPPSNVTTTPPPITSSTTTAKPNITTTAPTTTSSPPTTPSSTTPPSSSTTTSSTTSTTSAPSTTTEKPHPSDRKFDAFSFIGGFALAIGLVAIGFLAWKLYISRRDNVYHTL